MKQLIIIIVIIVIISYFELSLKFKNNVRNTVIQKKILIRIPTENQSMLVVTVANLIDCVRHTYSTMHFNTDMPCSLCG